MKTQTQHTPTPWTYRKAQQHFYIEAENAPGFGRSVAEVRFVGNHDTGWTSEANAAFIVTAVNSHETLIQAVKDLRYAFYVENSSKKLKEAFSKHADVLKDIIAQAEGK